MHLDMALKMTKFGFEKEMSSSNVLSSSKNKTLQFQKEVMLMTLSDGALWASSQMCFQSWLSLATLNPHHPHSCNLECKQGAMFSSRRRRNPNSFLIIT